MCAQRVHVVVTAYSRAFPVLLPCWASVAGQMCASTSGCAYLQRSCLSFSLEVLTSCVKLTGCSHMFFLYFGQAAAVCPAAKLPVLTWDSREVIVAGEEGNKEGQAALAWLFRSVAGSSSEGSALLWATLVVVLLGGSAVQRAGEVAVSNNELGEAFSSLAMRPEVCLLLRSAVRTSILPAQPRPGYSGSGVHNHITHLPTDFLGSSASHLQKFAQGAGAESVALPL